MIAIDPHTHTVASGHYTADTLQAVAKAAKACGLFAVGNTEHGPGMIGSTKESYFLALPSSERVRCGVRILFGAEANILDESGTLDLSERVLSGLDYVIASLHPPCFRPRDERGNTSALVSAARNPLVSILGHPNDAKYPVNLSELVAAAKETHTLLELNEASLVPGGYRGENHASAAELLRLCAEKEVPVVLSSDSHGAAGVGKVTRCEELLRETNFPDRLVANRDFRTFCSLLKRPLR